MRALEQHAHDPFPPRKGRVSACARRTLTGGEGGSEFCKHAAVLPTRREASFATPSPCGEGKAQRDSEFKLGALGFHQIEATFDPLHAFVEPVHAPMYSGHAFLDMREPDLDVLDVAYKSIDALFHPREARLDLLQHRHDKVGDFAHPGECICSNDVPQARGLTWIICGAGS